MKEFNEIMDITINEWIWIIFIILSIANIYGDELEKVSLKEKKAHDNDAKKIFLITASITLIIYIYFAINTYIKIENTKQKSQNINMLNIKLIGNILIVVGIICIIYFIYNDKGELTTNVL